jgi:hypothetical protein
MKCVLTIVSGGQTGVDRAALDFAIEHGLPHGGWCPRGRLAEDGPIPARYQLVETPSRRYAQRTEWNVRDSDATVVFTMSRTATGGTALTLQVARRLGKPWLHLYARERGDSAAAPPAQVSKSAKLLQAFLREHSVERLNTAGPRASQEPAVAKFAGQVLRAVLGTS